MPATLQGAPVTNSTGGTEVTSVTFAATVAAGTDTCMAVCVGAEGNGAGGISVSSITFNGDALTFHDEISNGTWSFSEVWQRIAPDVATGNVVVTMSAADKWVTGVYVANGVDQTTPLRAVAESTATGTSVSNTVAGVGTDDLVFDSLAIDSTSHAGTVGADQTERWDIEIASGYVTGLSSTQAGSAGGVMSWTWTGSNPYSHVATAFVAAAAALPFLYPPVGFSQLPQRHRGAVAY